MMSNKDEKKKTNKDENQGEVIKPDPKTLHTPDPQEKMEGPISSLMHEAGKGFDTDQSKEEADEEKEKNM